MRLRTRIRPAARVGRLLTGSLLAGTLLLGTACAGDPTGPRTITLSDGVAVTVSGGEDSERTFRIDVPAGAAGLNVTLTGASGDADLYLRFDERPTPDEYDCGSESFGGDEICFVPTPTPGSWFIVVYGFESYSGASLRATIADGPSATPLPSGSPVTDLAGPENSLRFFSVTVPAGATALAVSTTGGSGDVDLFVLRNFNEAMANCSSANDGNDEICNIANPVAGTWYVALQGFFEYAGVTLTATVTVAPTSVAPMLDAPTADGSILRSNATTLPAPHAARGLRTLRAATDLPRGPKRPR